ncbi:alpha-L-fucosidase [Solitalea koreensis]|uniref:alpha-L-fucosidase n=1 Tax=Solitalea koreensis TaxID=543615 RepID=A0A521BIT1_9SPHI|nr:alpha-L-fucosidase [Solitalea koreensis]SMO46949.1 alpha-L-fucosidase [Solitalea koreensis]
MKNILFRLFLAVLLVFQFSGLRAQEKEFPYHWPTDNLVSQKLKQWQDWKFGVIIHWGPYSQWGVVESWSLCPEDEGWCERHGPYAQNYDQYKKAYENIRSEFNPVQFDPQKWAVAAKNAGVKYVVFTTKHHDGFCMYDSKYTDYKITDKGSVFSKNPKNNVAKEVFSAFRNQGLGIGAYFSKPDWHSENYWWPYFPPLDRNVNYDPAKYPERWKNFQQYTYNQIEELTQEYGSLDILWLDGGQVRPASSLTEETKGWLGKKRWIQDINMPRIAEMARKNQPGILMVDRTVHGDFENYRTPEQQIPTTVPDYPWESCITLGNSWYHTGPNEQYKSVNWAIHTLIEIVAKGGNFLMGIGPDKTGNLAPEVYDRLKGIGVWMDVNSEGIYASAPLKPYQSAKWRFTKSTKGSQVYAFYLAEEKENVPTEVVLPALQPEKSAKIYLLGYTKPLSWKNGKQGIQINIPAQASEKLKGQPAWTFKIERLADSITATIK